MTIQDFEKQLKEMDPRFEIVPHPSLDDVAGVYFDKHKVQDKDIGVITLGFVITVPSKEIYEDYNENYVGATGKPYMSIPMATQMCKAYKERFDTDEEFRKLVSE